MTRDGIAQALSQGLDGALSAETPVQGVQQLLTAWMPVLRQALEQGGGDGLDVWLLGALRAVSRLPKGSRLWEADAGLRRSPAGSGHADDGSQSP